METVAVTGATVGVPHEAVAQLAERAIDGLRALVDLCALLGDVPVTADTSAGASAPVLRREGEYWAVRYSGPLVRVRDRKGMARLARLLAEPGREFHAMDLAGCVAITPVAVAREDRHQLPANGDNAGPLLDAPAKQAYRRRLIDLRDDIDEAEAFGDGERARRAHEELEAITGQLAAAVGLGGRNRRVASAAERARVSVTRTIREAAGRLGDHDAQLGVHLEQCVRTGVFCSYVPEHPVRWTVTTATA